MTARNATLPPEIPVNDPCHWMIVYDDAEVRAERFSGSGATEAAHRRFDQVKTGYNCHLFVRVAKG